MNAEGLVARCKRVAIEILPEGFGVVLIILTVWTIRHALEWALGKDAKFFDLIPIRYVTDAGELVVLVRFILRAARGRVGA